MITARGWASAVVLAVSMGLLGGCGGGGSAASSPFDGTSVTSSIGSAATGASYALNIWLPPGYATSTRTYPVVYATDCEYRFTTLVSVLVERAARNAAPAILVNVCAGTTAQRFHDYTMPAAASYYAFLTAELVPTIERQYRTNASKRVLSGHSLSGELAMYVLYLEDPAHRFFTSIVSEDGSFWFDAAFLDQGEQYAPALAMEAALYDADRRLPIDLFMAGDTNGNALRVTNRYNGITARQFQGLHAGHATYSLGHVPMDRPAFNDAMTFIFGD